MSAIMNWFDVDTLKATIGDIVDGYFEDHKIFIPSEERDRECLPANSFEEWQAQELDVSGALLYGYDWLAVVCIIEKAFMEKGIDVCDNEKHSVSFTEAEVEEIVMDMWNSVETVVSESPDKERFYRDGDPYRELTTEFRRVFREWELLPVRNREYWEQFVTNLTDAERHDLGCALTKLVPSW